MNSIICQTYISEKVPKKSIALSKSLMREWELDNGKSIEIQLGNKTIIAQAMHSNIKGAKAALSPTIAKSLHLPFQKSIRISYQNQCIRFGPVIGILTTGYTGNASAPFGKRSDLFRSFIHAGNTEKPLTYVFTPEMINWSSETIYGWYYLPTGKWIRHTFPFPDVIYERIPNRKAESLASVQSALSLLKEKTNCKIFNQGFFNKWFIHKLLATHPDTEEVIPETYLSPSVETIQRMLEDHKMVYLKPNKGSLGLGIFRITLTADNEYYCRFHQGDKNVLHRFKSLKKLIHYYFGQQNPYLKNYLVQQGIRLSKHNNRPVDFRVHMHKDQQGTWQVVAIGAKAAGFGCVTTHVRTGGSIISTDELLGSLFGEKASIVERNINDTSISIAQTLEDQIEGSIGELGMDIGVDRDENIWLFEVNSKPGRHIFLHPSLKEAGRKSAKYITDYSMNLANFT